MTGGTLAWGIAFGALCVITGILIGWPIGHARGLRHAAEDAEDAVTAAIVADWKGLPDEDARPAPPWPPAPPEPPTEVLEPTAVLSPPGLDDDITITTWTRQMIADMDQFIAERITATDSTLKEITGGAR